MFNYKNSVFFFVVIFIVSSCNVINSFDEEIQKSCGSVDSIHDLGWLDLNDDEDSDFCKVKKVYTGKYKGETVIIPILSGGLCCTCGNAVYNCKGEVLFSCDWDKEKKISNKKVIWKAK